MKKSARIVFLTVLFAFLPLGTVLADDEFVDLSSIVEESVNSIDFSDWDRFVTNDYFSEITGKKDMKGFISDLISGQTELSARGVLSAAFRDFSNEMKAHTAIASCIFGLAVLSALIGKISDGKTAKTACYLMLIACVLLTVRGFCKIVEICRGGLSDMADMTKTLLPFLLSFSAGSVQTPFGEDILMMAEGVSLLTEKVIIPLSIGVYVLNIADFISENGFFTSVSGTLKSFTDWLMGIMFSVFFGFSAVVKLISQSLQGSAAKAVKYTLTSFSLYGGTFLSKSFDIVTACSIIVKGIIGSAGMIVLLTVASAPAVRLLAASLVYRLASVFISATGEKKITSFLEMTGKVYGTLFLLVMTSAILFFVFVSAVTSQAGALLGI